MELHAALTLASTVVSGLTPYCSRIEISGSIRRRKPEVGDIEIVAIPELKYSADLFGTFLPTGGYTMDRVLSDIGILQMNGPRQKKIILGEGMIVDLFLVLPPAQWGVIFALRTGPAELSKWMVTKRRLGGALPSNAKMQDGAVILAGQSLPMPEERDFFAFLGLPYIEPTKRSLPLGAIKRLMQVN